MTAPAVVVFDVNGTLSDLGPMRRHLAEVGAPEATAEVWFASLLRDGFALTASGTTARFADVGAGALRVILSTIPSLNADLTAAVDHVMGGFQRLGVHADVPAGIRALAATGARLVTLSNGSTDVAERLLTTAGTREHFEQLLSVDDAGTWKPAPGAYAHAALACSVEPAAMLLVAAHPWDIDGAARAGLRTAWVDRAGQAYPDYFRPPQHTVTGVGDVAELLR